LPATLIGRILAHRREPPTIVRARLVASDGGDAASPAAADSPPGTAVEVPPAAPLAAPPVARLGAAGALGAPAADRDGALAAHVGTRYCPVCGERVPVAADGLHCRLGHRLSPAHARSVRRGLGRRG
jgi:hypothetical protein